VVLVVIMRVLLVCLLAVATGCGGASTIECTTNADCLQGGVPGMCRPSPSSSTMWCAFSDPSCTGTEERWGVASGDGLAGECVSGIGGPDGGIGILLSVSPNGVGSGVIVSDPAGISCEPTCVASFDVGTVVSLSASAGDDSFFEGWGGPCTGRATCELTLAAETTVTAQFTKTGAKRWLSQLGGDASDTLASLAADENGDVFVASSTSATGLDLSIQIAKVSRATGQPLWTRTFNQGTGNDQVNGYLSPWDVAVDPAGDVVIIGTFETRLDFDGTILTSPDRVFLVKLLGSTGAVVWAKSFGRASIYDLDHQHVAVDSMGNIYAAGEFTATFALGTATLTFSGSLGSSNLYLARFSPLGVPEWAIRATSQASIRTVAVSGTPATVVMAGSCTGSIDFGGQSFNTIANSQDAYIAKYSGSTGAYLFSKLFGGAMTDSVGALALDSNGEILLTGEYEGGVNLGGAILPGPAGLYLLELTPAGAHVFSNGIPVAAASTSMLTLSPTGDLWIGGGFNGSITLGGPTLTSASNADNAFIAKFSRQGVHRYSARFGGVDGASVAEAAHVGDALIVGGPFRGFAEFGLDTLTTSGQSDGYVVALVP
jgi:hypothetical protein